jgi:hypothetical protein
MKFNDGNMSYVMCGQKKNLNFPVVDILLNYDHITLNFVFSMSSTTTGKGFIST